MRLAITLTLVALSLGMYLYADNAASVSAPREPESALMQAKLKAVHDIVDGLVSKDFDRMQQSGATLASLSSGQDWRPHPDSVYGAYRDQLCRDAQKLAEMGRVNNLEGATYAYINVISTCIDCHAHCRDVLRIADPMPILQPVPNPAALDDDRFVR